MHDAVVQPRLPEVWGKLPVLNACLASYTYCFWIDLDTVITNFRVKLEERCAGFDLTIAKDMNGVNAGVMCMQASAWSRSFLQVLARTKFKT